MYIMYTIHTKNNFRYFIGFVKLLYIYNIYVNNYNIVFISILIPIGISITY